MQSILSSARRAGVAVTLAAALSAGCGLQISMDAEARDEWTRQYDVSAGATLEIRNGNGRIAVKEGDGSHISVRATRIVRASTEDVAKAALAEFRIEESAAPGSVTVNAVQNTGLSIGVTYSAEFDVTVPRGVNVVLTTTNGSITATRLAGRFQATGSNGSVTADGLSGPVQIDLTNGRIDLDLAAVADGGVTCETTNGLVSVTLPADANARLDAQTTNGAVSASDLDLAVTTQSHRRLDATIGGGGPRISLETTNGAIRINGRRQ